MKRYTKQEILSSVSILDLAKKFSLNLECISSGNFTHRCKCPSPDHKSGSERTGSLYIDSVNNNFYCFGCGASNNVIDFYILRNGCDFSTAITEMSEHVDPAMVSGKKEVVKPNNFRQLLAISIMFKKALRSHPEDRGWIDALMIKTDSYIDQIDRYDVKKTKALCRKVSNILKRRYS